MDTPYYLTIENVTQAETVKIFTRINISILTGCWFWEGAHSGDGYSAIYFHHKTYALHRFMYAWLIEAIPTVKDGYTNKGKGFLELDHLCNRRDCVNPAHLQLVTTKANVLRGEGITAQHARKTHCIHGHLLTIEPNTWDGKGRTCIECGRKRAREYEYQRRKRAEQKEYQRANRDKINARRREKRKKEKDSKGQV